MTGVREGGARARKRVAAVMAAGCFVFLATSGGQQVAAIDLPDDEANVVSYTRAQMFRGRNLYGTNCAECHGSDLAGGGGPRGGPPLVGEEFAAKWYMSSPAGLMAYMSTYMPAENPGTMDPDEYADILAYLIAQAGFPEGEEDLPADLQLLGAMTFPPLPEQ